MRTTTLSSWKQYNNKFVENKFVFWSYIDDLHRRPNVVFPKNTLKYNLGAGFLSCKITKKRDNDDATTNNMSETYGLWRTVFSR